MKPGYYWGRLKDDTEPMEPCKVQDDETVWFFMDEFHPMSIDKLDFGPELLPPDQASLDISGDFQSVGDAYNKLTASQKLLDHPPDLQEQLDQADAAIKSMEFKAAVLCRQRTITTTPETLAAVIVRWLVEQSQGTGSRPHIDPPEDGEWDCIIDGDINLLELAEAILGGSEGHPVDEWIYIVFPKGQTYRLRVVEVVEGRNDSEFPEAK